MMKIMKIFHFFPFQFCFVLVSIQFPLFIFNYISIIFQYLCSYLILFPFYFMLIILLVLSTYTKCFKHKHAMVSPPSSLFYIIITFLVSTSTYPCKHLSDHFHEFQSSTPHGSRFNASSQSSLCSTCPLPKPSHTFMPHLTLILPQFYR